MKTYKNPFPFNIWVSNMSKGIHRIESVEGTDIEFTESIRQFFKENCLMDCIFSNTEGEIGMIAVDSIVLGDLEKMVDWGLEPEDSELSKFRKHMENDLDGNALVHYRVY